MPKNAQTTAQLHSSHMLVKSCSKFSKPGLSNTWTMNFLMFKLVLGIGRGTRDQIANIRWIMVKAREFQKNIYFFFIDHGKAFDCVGHKKLWKILKEMGIPDHLTCLLRNLYASQEATLELNMEKQFSSVHFSRSVVSDSLRPHESQHARAPCPSPTPGVHSDSRPSSQ